jgi:hypothetical protein
MILVLKIYININITLVTNILSEWGVKILGILFLTYSILIPGKIMLIPFLLFLPSLLISLDL